MKKSKPETLVSRNHTLARIKGDVPFWIMLIIPIAYFVIFNYWPLFGLSVAFQDYKLGDPFISAESSWVGLKWFRQFLNSPFCWRWIRNTLLISLYDLIFNFPAGILLALILNEVRGRVLKNVASNVVLLPYFISTVVLVGMICNMFSYQDGIVNAVLNKLGIESVNFMGDPHWFRTMYTGSNIWAGAGFASIVYTAAISGIDPALYEAAKMDGASRLKCIFHITIPCILPTIITMFILRVGSFMSVGYEKIILMYTPATYETADILSTYAYRAGILDGKSSLSTAIGLFNGVCNIILLVTANKVTKKLSDTALW